MNRPILDLSASIRQRLLNIAREREEELQILFMRYGVERYLYRLSKTKYNSQFVLKGAMLLAVLANEPYRTTKDLDFLGYGDDSPERLVRVFRDICLTEVEPDGLEFDTDSIHIEEIRGEFEYGEHRIRLISFLGNARIPLQIDVAFGDAITLEVLELDYPTLLDLPRPQIRAYPPETVIAEKLQTLVDLGIQNSRMKDFFDLYFLSNTFDFDGEQLAIAIKATFKRRGTKVPDQIPLALSDEFSNDRDKQEQWRAFLRKNKLQNAPEDLVVVIEDLGKFLLPPLMAAGRNDTFEQSWAEGGKWQ
jgi:predicted nucleotidyltransferase component of viral defense system